MGIFSNNPEYFRPGGQHYGSGKKSVTVDGFEDAVKFLKTLPENINRKVLVSSIRRASRPFVAAVKREAPIATRKQMEYWGAAKDKRLIEPGLLKKSVGVIVAKAKNKNFLSVYVGPKKTKAGSRKRIANDAWYRHFVIRGTAGFTIKKGKNIGRFMPGQAANPFVDRAYSQTGTQVGNAIEANITDAVSAYCKRKGITFLKN